MTDTVDAARIAPGRRRVDDDATETASPRTGSKSATVTVLDAARVAPSLRRLDDTATEGFRPQLVAGVRDSATDAAAHADDEAPTLSPTDDHSPPQE